MPKVNAHKRKIPGSDKCEITNKGVILAPSPRRSAFPLSPTPTFIWGTGKHRKRLGCYKKKGEWVGVNLALLMAKVWLGSNDLPGFMDGDPTNCELSNLVLKKNGRPVVVDPPLKITTEGSEPSKDGSDALEGIRTPGDGGGEHLGERGGGGSGGEPGESGRDGGVNVEQRVGEDSRRGDGGDDLGGESQVGGADNGGGGEPDGAA